MKTFKENRLLFDEKTPAGPAAAPQGAKVDKPKDKPTETPKATETPEVQKAAVQIQTGMYALIAKYIIENKDSKYTDEIKKDAQGIFEKCEAIEKIFKDNEKDLPKALKKIEEDGLMKNLLAAVEKIQPEKKEDREKLIKDAQTFAKKKEADKAAKSLTETQEKQKSVATRAYDIMIGANDGKDLDFSKEDLQQVLGFYKLGAYEPSEDQGNSTKVMDALRKYANKLKDANPPVLIGYTGGTDGTDHQLMKGEKYHEEKADALDKLLAFYDSKKLTVAVGAIDLTKDSSTRKLIEEYIEAKKPKQRYAFAKAHKEDFLPGGRIFDAALAVQRAEDRKKSLSGDKTASFKVDDQDMIDKDDPGLVIELGKNKDKKEERKSGIFLIEGEKKPDDTKVEKPVEKKKPTYEIDKGKTIFIYPPKDPDHPNDMLIKYSYILNPIDPVKAELVAMNPKDPLDTPPKLKIDGKIIPLPLDDQGFPISGPDSERRYSIIATPPDAKTEGKIEVKKFEPPYRMGLDGTKLTVKFNGEEIAKGYDINLPEEVTATPDNLGNLVLKNKDGDNALIYFTDDKKPEQSFRDDTMCLRRNYEIVITDLSITVKKREKPADHGYKYDETKQELTVINKNKTDDKPITYKLQIPDGALISTGEDEKGDYYLTIDIENKSAYFELDDSGTKLVTGSVDGKKGDDDLNKTHDFKIDGTNIIIAPKPAAAQPEAKPQPAPQPAPAQAPASEPAPAPSTPKPTAADDNVHKPLPPEPARRPAEDNVHKPLPPSQPATPSDAPADSTPSAPAENRDAVKLNDTLSTAKKEIEKKIKSVEETINSEEGFVTKDAASEKISAAKADFKRTFEDVRKLLKTAEEKAKEGDPKAAKEAYLLAQKTLEEKMKRAQEQDPKESYLAEATRKKIDELRKEVAKQKSLVDDAFKPLVG